MRRQVYLSLWPGPSYEKIKYKRTNEWILSVCIKFVYLSIYLSIYLLARFPMDVLPNEGQKKEEKHESGGAEWLLLFLVAFALKWNERTKDNNYYYYYYYSVHFTGLKKNCCFQGSNEWWSNVRRPENEWISIMSAIKKQKEGETKCSCRA